MSDIPELVAERQAIDNIDDQIEIKFGEIMVLVAERWEHVGHVATIKSVLNLEAYQPERFKQMLERLKIQGAGLGLRSVFVEKIWTDFQDESIAIQQDVSSSDAIIE
ncbi:MAG TPA: chorismate mutase [Candidatus Saccharimonadales bacterium]|nr:chorismate mutase [Candidatus Saccharimonadales bacterium]